MTGPAGSGRLGEPAGGPARAAGGAGGPAGGAGEPAHAAGGPAGSGGLGEPAGGPARAAGGAGGPAGGAGAVLDVLAPVAGRVLPLAEVPDPVFSAAMVGPGLALDPVRSPGEAVAPVAGTIVTLHPHAFVVAAAGDRGVLVHLGLDTVQLKGAGFTLLAAQGDVVAAGQPVVRWDPAGVEAGGRSPVCPVVALDAPAGALTALAAGAVAAGSVLFRWT